MKSCTRIAFAGVVAVLGLANVELTRADGVQGRLISGLGVDESAVIDLTSSGCFHYVHYEFTFVGKPSQKVKVTNITGDGDQAIRRDIGTLSLSEVDQRSLNQLLTYYRSKRLEGGTTHERVEISWRRGGVEFAKESTVDQSCMLPEGAISLFDLVERAEECWQVAAIRLK